MAKYLRIVERLQEAGGDGVLEIELFPNENRKGGSIREMLKVVRRHLGGVHTVTVDNGIWCIAKDHRKMTPALYAQLVILDEVIENREETIKSRKQSRRTFYALVVLIGLSIFGIYKFFSVFGPYIV